MSVISSDKAVLWSMMNTEKGFFCHHVLILYLHNREEEEEEAARERKGKRYKTVKGKLEGRKKGEQIYGKVKGGGCG